MSRNGPLTLRFFAANPCSEPLDAARCLMDEQIPACSYSPDLIMSRRKAPLTETLSYVTLTPQIRHTNEQLFIDLIHHTLGSSIASALQVLCKSVRPCAA